MQTESLDSVGKLSYVLGSELWENNFDSLLSLVKEYVVDVWEIRKHILYGDDSSSGPSLHLGIWLGFNGKAMQVL